MKILFSILTISIGVFMIFFGGMDDSPGAQGIGVLAIIAGVVFIIKSRKKSRN